MHLGRSSQGRSVNRDINGQWTLSLPSISIPAHVTPRPAHVTSRPAPAPLSENDLFKILCEVCSTAVA